jgi:probable HAF family extracellular repeat protein
MYTHTVKLSFKSFMSALLAVLLLAVSVSTQTQSRTYPGRPPIEWRDPATVNARTRAANDATGANRQRPTIRDMILSEEQPPRESLKRGNDKAKTPAQQKATPDSDHPLTIPHWSDTFTYQGLTYKYTMVGTDPKRGSATTVIPTVIITLRFTFEAGTPVYDEGLPVEGDGINHIIALETGVVDKIIDSPIFRTHEFNVGGVSVGDTQYGDAFQRANFWDSVSGRSPDYHVLLGQPTVAPTVDVFVPKDVAALYVGEDTAFISLDFLHGAVENAIRQNNISPQTLPIVLWPSENSVFHGSYQVPGGVQTYIASGNPLLEDPSPDPLFNWGKTEAMWLSATVLNWLNNPFKNNFMPGWNPPENAHPRCKSFGNNDNLEVDAFSGRAVAVMTVDTEFGRYGLVFGAFLDYFTREAPSSSAGGQYAFADIRSLLFDPDTGRLVETFTSVDSPSPPCVGHVEVEKRILEFPNALWTRAYGISNHGWVVGDFADESNRRHGFVYDGQRFTQLDYPGAAFTIPNDIDDSGRVVGTFYDSARVPHGFLYFQGSFTRIDFPGSADTFVRSINSRGDFVGMYDALQEITHGFIYRDGQYRTIDTPYGPPLFGPQTDVTGINNQGRLVGLSWDNPEFGPFIPFSLDRTGFVPFAHINHFDDIDYPRAINNRGEHGGWHLSFHDLVWGLSGYVTIYGYPYVVHGNGVFGMNDNGQIVGNTFDPTLGRTVGYLATLPK